MWAAVKTKNRLILAHLRMPIHLSMLHRHLIITMMCCTNLYHSLKHFLKVNQTSKCHQIIPMTRCLMKMNNKNLIMKTNNWKFKRSWLLRIYKKYTQFMRMIMIWCRIVVMRTHTHTKPWEAQKNITPKSLIMDLLIVNNLTKDIMLETKNFKNLNKNSMHHQKIATVEMQTLVDLTLSSYQLSGRLIKLSLNLMLQLNSQASIKKSLWKTALFWFKVFYQISNYRILRLKLLQWKQKASKNMFHCLNW